MSNKKITKVKKEIITTKKYKREYWMLAISQFDPLSIWSKDVNMSF